MRNDRLLNKPGSETLGENYPAQCVLLNNRDEKFAPAGLNYRMQGHFSINTQRDWRAAEPLNNTLLVL